MAAPLQNRANRCFTAHGREALLNSASGANGRPQLGTILAVAWPAVFHGLYGRARAESRTRVEQMTNMISKDAPAAKGKAAQQEAPAPADAAATAETA